MKRDLELYSEIKITFYPNSVVGNKSWKSKFKKILFRNEIFWSEVGGIRTKVRSNLTHIWYI